MSKDRVLKVYPTARALKNDEGWFDVRTPDKLLGQGGTAASAWWDAYQGMYPHEKPKALDAAGLNTWPFRISEVYGKGL